MSPRTEVLEALREMARERPVAVTVRGGCMAPGIAEGDRVEVAPARLYWPGDVIVFQAADGGPANGRWLVHRLLGWRWWQGGPAAVTRGDGCPCHDAPVPFGRILGRVVGPAGRAGRLRAVGGFLGLLIRRIRPIGPISSTRHR